MNLSPRQRDRHLQRVSRITRWLVVAAAGATGVFAFVLARPSSTSAKATVDASGSGVSGSAATSRVGSSGATTTTTGRSGSKSSSSSKSSSQLKAAPQPPKRSSGGPVASSGGS